MMSFRRETPNTPQRPSLHAKSCMPNKTWRLYSRTQTHLLLGQRSIKLQLQFPVMSLTVAAHVERVLRGDYKTKLPICMTPAKNTCCPRDSCRYPRGGHHTCHLVCDDLSICATLLTTPGQVTQQPQWPCKTSIITAICSREAHSSISAVPEVTPAPMSEISTLPQLSAFRTSSMPPDLT